MTRNFYKEATSWKYKSGLMMLAMFSGFIYSIIGVYRDSTSMVVGSLIITFLAFAINHFYLLPKWNEVLDEWEKEIKETKL